jgi:hypothetical protein
LVINKDPTAPHSVRVAFRDSERRRDLFFVAAVEVATFRADNYVWHPNGPEGYADPDGPIVHAEQPGGPNAVYVLPKASITVLRGAIH